MNRESWLIAACTELTMHFLACGRHVVPPVRISTGFPSRSALSRKKRRIGECWSGASADDGVVQILISPVLGDPVEVLAVVAHELVHATVGNKHGHDSVFGSVARAIGLEGKMTSTVPGAAFKLAAGSILAKIGPYPHSPLNGSIEQKKQGTRLLKCKCKVCGCVVRITAMWLNSVGAPACGCGAGTMSI